MNSLLVYKKNQFHKGFQTDFLLYLSYNAILLGYFKHSSTQETV